MLKQKKAQRSLIAAAEAGDLKVVKREVKKKYVDVDKQGPQAGALHVAASGGFLDIVEVLLDAGANPSLPSAQGYTPLHLAVSKDHAPVTERLLAAGAPLEARTRAEGTPLHVALAARAVGCARLLVEAGADVEAADFQGRRPLHVAATAGSVEALQLLLGAGAQPDSTNARGRTALLQAIEQALEKKHFPDESQEMNLAIDAAAWLVADQPHTAVQADARGLTPLHWAAELGELRLLDVLDQQPGVEWTLRTDKGATVLHHAVRGGRPAAVRWALGRLPDQLHAVDRNGWTPLHQGAAARKVSDELLRLLVDAGADLQAKTTADDRDVAVGSTALDVALALGNRDAAVAAGWLVEQAQPRFDLDEGQAIAEHWKRAEQEAGRAQEEERPHAEQARAHALLRDLHAQSVRLDRLSEPREGIRASGKAGDRRLFRVRVFDTPQPRVEAWFSSPQGFRKAVVLSLLFGRVGEDVKVVASRNVCTDCWGTGSVDDAVCEACQGEGWEHLGGEAFPTGEPTAQRELAPIRRRHQMGW